MDPDEFTLAEFSSSLKQCFKQQCFLVSSGSGFLKNHPVAGMCEVRARVLKQQG